MGMTCFEWHNRSSDYLDGTLVGSDRQTADAHLESCKDCHERHQRYRLILTSLASQPRSSLPIPIRKAPLSSALPRVDLSKASRSRWEQIPWYIRTTIEGTGIVLLILLGISAGPKIRALAERNLERNVSEFSESVGMPEGDATALHLPLGRGKPNGTEPEGATGQAKAPAAGDEFASEGNDDDTESAEGSLDDSSDGGTGTESVQTNIRVGAQEIWRFNMKTDSPHELRPRVVTLLAELKIPASTPGLGGTEAPGGIQFDLMLPQSVVPALKVALQKLAPRPVEGLAGSSAGETFTWYKNRSRNPVPAGKTHVVIWLSQI